MNTLTHIAPRSGVVTLPVPLRGNPQPVQIPEQKRRYDSNKKIYTIRKKQEAIFQYPLSWDHLPLTTKDQLLALAATAQGSKYPITWNDHLGVDHTVNIIGKIEWKQNTSSTCRCSITLEERIWCVYGGADGSILTGADGTILTW